MGIIWRVSSYVTRYRVLFFLTITLAVTSMLFGIAVPRVIRWIFNSIMLPGHLNDLWKGTLIVAGCYAMRDVLNSIRIRINNTLEQRVLIDLRKDLHRKLLELPISFYDRRKSGEVASRIIEDVQNLERGLLDGTEQGTTSFMMVFGIIIMLFTMQPKLAIVVIIPLPIILLLMRNHWRATRKNWKSVRESAGDLNSLLVEDIQGNRLIQSFALQKREHSRFMQCANTLKDRTLKAMYRWSIYSPSANFIGSLGCVAVIGMGGYLIIQDPGFNAGDLLAFFLYAIMLYEPLNRLHGLNHMLAAATASGKRVFEILDHENTVPEPNESQRKPFPYAKSYEVIYENVDFAYPERSPVVEELNLTLEAGQTTALVGHTGAGKSTIANLLLRYYDTTTGSVTINGTNVSHIPLEELRSEIGYVAQDPFLFDGTVRENMLLAKPDASEKDVIRTLKSASAWDFVERLPQGLDTLIGERGVRLSQGEKQRLTIARVLLKNPPIVILDEATASVDTQTERFIQEALDQLMENRTVLIIAHRLSTVRKAQKIVVLEKGRIIEQGSHKQLITKKGKYASLWFYQHDFIPEEN